MGASFGFNNDNNKFRGKASHKKTSKPGPVTFNVRENNNPTRFTSPAAA